MDNEWHEVGSVQTIYLYPLKSAKGLQVPNVQVTKYGLHHGFIGDRRLMFINDKNVMITARQFSKLVMINIDFKDEDNFTLNGPLMSEGHFKLPRPDQTEKIKSSIHGKSASGYKACPAASAWITKYVHLHHGEVDFKGEKIVIHIVYQPISVLNSGPERQVQSKSSKFTPLVRPDDVPIFADDYPVNIQTQSSLDELNRKIGQENKIKVGHFRPNIFVADGTVPFEEDHWLYIKINDAEFRYGQKCGRCLLTTVNPDTGLKETDGEPLKTLKLYRSPEDPEERDYLGASPFFGVQLCVERVGSFKTGDKIYVKKI